MRRIDLESIPWVKAAEGVRSKSMNWDDCQVRLVEFAPGFTETEWCLNAHIGYVVVGRLAVEFADATEIFSSGDALLITAGDQHRAKVIEGPVRLFLVDGDPT